MITGELLRSFLCEVFRVHIIHCLPFIVIIIKEKILRPMGQRHHQGDKSHSGKHEKCRMIFYLSSLEWIPSHCFSPQINLLYHSSLWRSSENTSCLMPLFHSSLLASSSLPQTFPGNSSVISTCLSGALESSTRSQHGPAWSLAQSASQATQEHSGNPSHSAMTRKCKSFAALTSWSLFPQYL